MLGGAAGTKAFGKYGGVVSGGFAMFGADEGAYKKGSELSGTIGGAAAGAQMGSIVPGIGTAIGAVAGGIGGFLAGMFGFDAQKRAAENYLKDQVAPKMASAQQRYYQGGENYDQAQRELQQLAIQEKDSMGKWGKAGNDVWAESGYRSFSAAANLMLSAEEAGRSSIPRGMAEFHSGGFVGAFGSGDLGNDEGLAKLKRGEFISDEDTTSRFRPLLESLPHAATVPMHPASSGGEVHLHVHAFDLPNFERFLSGGGDQKVLAAINRYQGIYAGMADNE